MAPNYQMLPENMRGDIRRYIERGIEPGHFLAALLSNDFMEAVGRADDENQRHIITWARFLCNEAPRGCFGSPENYRAWVENRGLNGTATG